MNPEQLLYQLDALKGAAMSGSEVPLETLRALHGALRDNMMKASQGSSLRKAGVGYPIANPQDSSTVPGGDYAPLVPQSIQPMYDIVTADSRHLVLTGKLASSDVTSPVTEWTRLTRFGGTMTSPFIPEAGVPAITQTNYDRQVVRMKYMATFRQLTDVLAQTSLLSGVGAARALEAANGSMDLALQQERWLLWSDSAINPLEYDGLIAAIERGASTNVYDAEGATVSGQELQTYAAFVVSSPNYGEPVEYLMCPRHFTWYTNQLVPFRRADMAVAGPLTLAAGKISVGTYQGEIPFTVMPLLEPIHHPMDRTEGDGPPTAFVPVGATVAGGTTSKWRAADVAGLEFYYTFVIVGDAGATRTVNVGPFTLAAGQALEFSFADNAAALSGIGSVRYYVAYRATVAAGAAAPTDPALFFQCGRYGRNIIGGATTEFIDPTRLPSS
jgi:hypothetical protein